MSDGCSWAEQVLRRRQSVLLKDTTQVVQFRRRYHLKICLCLALATILLKRAENVWAILVAGIMRNICVKLF